MPAPINPTETTLAIAKLREEEGVPQALIGEEIGVSQTTVHRWLKSCPELSPKAMQQAKQAITAIDYQGIKKIAFSLDKVQDEIHRRIELGGLKKTDWMTLIKTGVELSKMYGIRWDKVLLRDGSISQGLQNVSHDSMLALILAKTEQDRQRKDLIKQELDAFKALQAKDPRLAVIDVAPA